MNNTYIVIIYIYVYIYIYIYIYTKHIHLCIINNGQSLKTTLAFVGRLGAVVSFERYCKAIN